MRRLAMQAGGIGRLSIRHNRVRATAQANSRLAGAASRVVVRFVELQVLLLCVCGLASVMVDPHELWERVLLTLFAALCEVLEGVG